MTDRSDALNTSPDSPLGTLFPLQFWPGAPVQQCFPEQTLHFSFLKSAQAIVYSRLADTKSHS